MKRVGIAIVLVAALGLTGCNVRYGWGFDTPTKGSTATAPVDVGGGKAWRTVDAGMSRTCGIDAGQRLTCEGFYGDVEAVGPSTPPQWTSVSVGFEHQCALWGAGDLYCWGSNNVGELGLGTTSDYEATPQRVGVASDWTAVAAGQHDTCGIRGGGELYCWGAGTLVGGVVGDGTEEQRESPTRIGTASDWTAIDVAYGSCGLRGSGELWCWGYGSGDGTAERRLSPVRVGTESDWDQVSVGIYHSCGLRSLSLYCWGGNDYGQLGDGTTTTRLAPVRVGTESYWTSVSAGGTNQAGGSGGGNEYWSAHTCGIRAPGTLWCWGKNQRGELGDGTTTSRLTPVRIGTESDWAQVASGGDFTEGLRAEP
ncbi:MAG: hypothetical protein KF703_08605 [Actinobacteria bacterium]|nr:hypothetical protein [Actinomycetota bacterium]